MAVINRISNQGLPIERVAQFSATYNAFGAGEYNFTLNTSNQKIPLLDLDDRYYYMIDRLSFSASIPEGVYLSSVLTNAQARLFFKNTPYPVYPYAIPLINYKDNLEFNFWFHTNKQNDQLLISVEGILDQIAETVGITTIYTQVSFVIYVEQNERIIEQHRDREGKAVKEFYK